MSECKDDSCACNEDGFCWLKVANPDSCLNASELKTVADNPELKLVAVPKNAEKFSRYPDDGAILESSGVHGYRWWQKGIYGWQRKPWEI